MGGVWVQLLGAHGAGARVILVLRDCNLNALSVSLVLLTFEDTGSLGSPPRQVPPWVTASRFLARNTEAELNPPLSLHSYSNVLSCLSSSHNPPAI